MAEDWSYLLPASDRSAFLEACREAQPDDARLHTILSRYFSTWKTSLMHDDLNRLEKLATCVPIQKHIQVMCIEDDFDETEERAPSESSIIWPRHADGTVVAEGLGLGVLKSILAAKQLRLRRLEIRDKRTSRTPSDPEMAGLLARNIFEGADLAITSLIVRKDMPMTTIIAAELSPEHQGQGIGFSLLRKAEVLFNQDVNSHWARQIFFHAPQLKELSLSFWRPHNMPHTSLFPPGSRPLPELETLELSTAMLSLQSIMTILSNSKQSLRGISFSLTTLVDQATWQELLARIGNDFPRLAWFKLRYISEGPIGQSKVTFPALGQDSVVGEPDTNRLKLLQRGPVGQKRISGVDYEGPDANHVLGIVAKCAQTPSAPG